jgi:predicted ATPase
MKISGMRLVGIRCFEDTGDLVFGNNFNIIVGQNNSGKSTLLRAILNLQYQYLDGQDLRSTSPNVFVSVSLSEIKIKDAFRSIGASQPELRVILPFQGNSGNYNDLPLHQGVVGNPVFLSDRPHHKLVPFLAKRKASGFSEAISSGAHSPVTGTLHNLYSSVDILATNGHPKHATYIAASKKILGLIVTTNPSPNGKVAGFWLNDDTFITLDRMGDGVAEIIALITELCLAKDKIFILEELETNLHPKGLKALLDLVRESSLHNQFFIATHSNVVVRELGGEPESKVFGVYRDDPSPQSPSRVEEVERTPVAHMQLLRELGYEFTDFSLFDGWLFLEESSAERVVRDILIPFFVPKLKGRLRTFAAGGVNDLEPSVAEFRRLIVFVHLLPVYEGRLWARADGDEAGVNAISKMKISFPNFDDETLATFEKLQFEEYYPAHFADEVKTALSIVDKVARRKAKTALLLRVLAWTNDNPDEANCAWETSAAEIITLLKLISGKIG